MAKIVGVDKGSIADEIHLKAGDEVIAFDGYPVEDILDYIFYDAKENFTMTVISDGDESTVEIDKDPDESLGITFGCDMELDPKRCKNKCMFCFVDQLPKGMRDTLYVKDDDYRCSFALGNYVTLTNVTDKDLERIVRLGLSPLYVSVHSYDKEVKRELISNPEGAKLFDKIDYLVKNGIKLHTQIVMCKGINDGEVLTETLSMLEKYYPSVESVAIVPVGLTKHREGLKPLSPIDKKKAEETISAVEKFNEKYVANGGFAFCSDEFYIKAGRELPKTEYYGDFSQIENGVGLVRQFIDDIDYALEEAEPLYSKKTVYSVTGQSFKDILRRESKKFTTKFPNLDFQVMDIVNEFFGESITVAGLITGGDIVKQLRGKVSGDMIVPSTMLREFTDTFLDGVKVADIERELGVKIHISHGGEDVVRIISEVLR